MVEVIFDIETKSLFGDKGATQPHQLGVSVVSVLRREVSINGIEKDREMKSFWDPEAKNIDGGVLGFDEMWKWFEEADRIIGFNSLGFDVPALVPLYKAGNLAKMPHFDLMDKVKGVLGHRLSLDAIAKETLSYTKIDNGLNAVKYWASQDAESMAKLRKYCEMDVVVTTDVYKYGFTHGILKYKDKWNESKQVKVDFSYPKPVEEQETQIGLF